MTTTPGHVSPELVWSERFDSFTGEGGDPVLAVSRLKEGPPLVWTADAANGRPGWIATRHQAYLGIHLAKRELAAVVASFLERFASICLKLGETYRYHTGRTFGIDYLPLELTP